jgi:hypothetical protein
MLEENSYITKLFTQGCCEYIVKMGLGGKKYDMKSQHKESK